MQESDEAIDKVWDLNRILEKALETLAILNVRFEKVREGLGEADAEFDRNSGRCRTHWKQGVSEVRRHRCTGGS